MVDFIGIMWWYGKSRWYGPITTIWWWWSSVVLLVLYSGFGHHFHKDGVRWWTSPKDISIIWWYGKSWWYGPITTIWWWWSSVVLLVLYSGFGHHFHKDGVRWWTSPKDISIIWWYGKNRWYGPSPTICYCLTWMVSIVFHYDIIIVTVKCI